MKKIYRCKWNRSNNINNTINDDWHENLQNSTEYTRKTNRMHTALMEVLRLINMQRYPVQSRWWRKLREILAAYCTFLHSIWRIFAGEQWLYGSNLSICNLIIFRKFAFLGTNWSASRSAYGTRAPFRADPHCFNRPPPPESSIAGRRPTVAARQRWEAQPQFPVPNRSRSNLQDRTVSPTTSNKNKNRVVGCHFICGLRTSLWLQRDNLHTNREIFSKIRFNWWGRRSWSKKDSSFAVIQF